MKASGGASVRIGRKTCMNMDLGLPDAAPGDWRSGENPLSGRLSGTENGLKDEREDMTGAEARPDREGAGSRVRFKGIVESGSREAAEAAAEYGIPLIVRNEDHWNAKSRQLWLMARLTALFVFFAFMVGLPLGNYLAYRKITGGSQGWSLLAGYQTDILMFAIVVPVLIIFLGYLGSRIGAMVNAAESIAAAAQQFVSPDVAAMRNVDTVGEVVRGHMTALNEGLDGALTRLASVESMIRQHVEAIEIAGEAIELKAVGAVERVADERSRLMDLTESLNAHADSFAAAIAERAKASISALEAADTVSGQVEQDFDDRLTRLEEAAERALSSFEALRDALRDTDEHMRASAQSIDEAADFTFKATERANAASNAAAESAARNAANVAASANRAADTARKAADDAIGAAAQEAERIAEAAIVAAAEKTGRVREAAEKALGEMTKLTSGAIESARADADKATKAAADVTEAARQTSEAAKAASADVAAASDRARQSSEDAIKYSEDAAARIEERNKALAEARAALEKENARLESLIEEQRNRADRLADAIATQTERLSKLAEAQLREQEAAAKLAEAEKERLAAEAAEAKEAERKAKAEAERLAREEAAAAKQAEEERKAAEAEAARAAALAKQQDELQLTPKDAPAKKSNGAARLEELARDIAERRPRNGARDRKEPVAAAKKTKDAAASRSKGDISWREILDAAEDAEPLDLGEIAKPAAKTAAAAKDDALDAIRIISQLQDFTYELETRLYGDPPPALAERYDRGDRNVFANRLLRLNEADVKRRIRSESARDRTFESGVHEFLQGFEKLLEDATTSDTADEELEEYLSSPLGRVYLLIGATVGYFA